MHTELDLRNELDALTYLDGADTDIAFLIRSSEVFAANGYRPEWLAEFELKRFNEHG